MDLVEIFAIIIAIGIMTLPVQILILIIIYIIVERKRRKILEEEQRKKKEEEERKRRIFEEQQRAHAEYINNTRCYICKGLSFGNAICQKCIDRSKILFKETPKYKISNYEKTYNYFLETKNNILNSDSYYDIETYSIKALGIANYMSEKYLDIHASSEITEIITQIRDNGYIISKDLKNKYLSNIKEETTDESISNNQTNDYRKKHSANFRCTDGKYVRSKAEREIANFFFDNNIRYIYEDEYYSVQRDKTYYPDFFLPDYYLIIEYFGRTDPEYLNKKNEKIEVYKMDPNVKFEYLDQNNDYDIAGALKKICTKHNIPTK